MCHRRKCCEFEMTFSFIHRHFPSHFISRGVSAKLATFLTCCCFGGWLRPTSWLHHSFGIADTAVSWFQPYLYNLTQVVSVDGESFVPAALNFGVLKGSVLGPILFVLYSYSISEIVSYHIILHHSFSDDNQLYKPGDLSELPQMIYSTVLHFRLASLDDKQ